MRPSTFIQFFVPGDGSYESTYECLTDNSPLIMIDHQSQMSFATKSIDAVLLRNNCALVAKGAREFKVSTILTTVAEKSFSGPIYEEIRSVFPQDEVIDRTTMNAWEDARASPSGSMRSEKGGSFWRACGPVCIVGPALSALDQGFDVYVIADACGDISAGNTCLLTKAWHAKLWRLRDCDRQCQRC